MSRPDIPGYQINQISSSQDPNVTSAQDLRRRSSEPIIWAGGRQRPVLSEGEQRSILGSSLAVGAGVFAAGALPYKGQRVWDAYIRGAQAVERMSPGRILSTYRTSEILSPLGTLDPKLSSVVGGNIAWKSDFWKDKSRQGYLEKLVGKSLFQKHRAGILEKGVILDTATGQLKTAKTGDILLNRATKLSAHSLTGQAEFYKNYARSIGAPGLNFVDESIKYLPIGGKNMLQAYSRYGYGLATEQVNRILRVVPTEIAELPIIRGYKERLAEKLGPKVEGSKYQKGFRKVFPAFEAGAAHQTISRYLMKRVLPAVALWKGAQLADYLTGDSLSGAAFGAYSYARIGKAKLMEATGMQQFAERQEEIAPGSTSLLGLAAFPAGGALLGFGAYGARMYRTAAGAKKFGWAESAKLAGEHFSKEDYNVGFGLGKKLGFESLKKRTLSSAMRRTGALAGLAYALPFLPGALAGTDTSEELSAIYSGEKEVGIRKGRAWEMGRCNTSESLIFLDLMNSKIASRIEIGDTLLGADGQSHNIINIYTRYHKGTILKFKTALDRNVETGLTLNHMVQVLKGATVDGKHINKEDRKEEFIEARTIDVGDFVQVPIPKLKEDLININTSELIKVGLHIKEDEYVYSAQRNWYNGKIQKARGNKIPDTVVLNEDIGRLFGYFIAEGNLSFKDNIPTMIETVHAVSEKWIVDDIVSICEKYFDVTPTFKHRTNFKKAIEGAWIVRICNSLLARMFFELFYKSDRAVDKFIPEMFLDAPNYFKLALVEGYWRGDGHLDRSRRVISSCRKQLIEFSRIVLLANGIATTTPKAEVRRESGFKDKHRLGWNADTEYKDVQGFQWIEDKLYVRIFSIEEEDYDGTVYDFEIDHEDHLIVNGTFLVHNSPFEGGKIQYFRQHFIPMTKAKAKIKALYGSEFDKMRHDPFFNPIGAVLDPYAYEKEHYYEFPFPVTSSMFEDVPFIGPTLSATLGQLIKPSKIMHASEWMTPMGQSFGPAGIFQEGQGPIQVGQAGRGIEGYGYGEGGFAVRRLPQPFGQTTAYELGELPKGIPVDPHSPTQVFGEQAYRFTEMFGLTGFTAGSIKEKLTGRAEFYDQYERLETSRRATGIERAYWDMQIGGGFLSTELFRRLYPHKRNQIDFYNTIKNMQPGWMPGPGEPSPDFQHGFAFGKILEGEVRLPGRGYAALHPELEGVAPEDYSLIHRYKILQDVAPYSTQAKFYKQAVQELRKQGGLTEQDEQMYQTIRDQRQQVKESLQPFGKTRHRFIEQDTTTQTVTIKRMIEPGKFEVQEMPGVMISMAGIKTSQAALSRLAITEHNEITKEEAGIRANIKRAKGARLLKESGVLPGTQVQIEIGGDILRQYAKTGSDTPEIRAVVRTQEGVNLNRMLMEAQVAEYDKASAGVLEGQVAFSKLERAIGTYWEAGAKALDQPTEFMTPFSPGHKFLFGKTRTATEMYAASQAYGTTSAFWDKPWENFLRPAMRMFGYKYLGMDELPANIQQRNEIEEYYDKLKYVKYTRLKNEAAAKGDTEAAKEYELKRNRTAFGADPYGNPINALLAMQKRDKPYFDAFVKASSEAERDQIMTMLPKYERHLVRARWNVDLIRQLHAERKVKGSLSPEQNEMLTQLQQERAAEGQDVSAEAISAYKSYTRWTGDENMQDYADFQRERELAEYFQNKPLPRADWVGFHPQADLEDIKLVQVNNQGCISGDSCIFNGALEEVCASLMTKGDSIMNSDGDTVKVKERFKYINANNLYEISNSGIALGKIIITDNHIVPVVRQSTYSYKMIEVPVSKIRKQDKMLYPKMKFEESFSEADLISYAGRNENSIWDVADESFRFNSNGHTYKRGIVLDADFGKFLGWYIAEGNIIYRDGNTKGIQLSLSSKEYKEANWIVNYVKRSFGVNSTIYENKKRNAISVIINGKPIANLVLSLCGGNSALSKNLTDSFLDLPVPTILNAMLSWHHGDGWVSKMDNGGKATRLYVTTSSRKLAKQGWYILNSLGIRTRMQVVKEKAYNINEKTGITKQSYRLGVGDKVAMKAFLSCIVAKQSDYYDKIKFHESLEGYFWFGIRKEYIGNKNIPVYDFDVGVPHKYVTVCGIIHNSDMHDFNLWESREKSLPYKPYIDEEAMSQVMAIDQDMSSSDIQATLHDILATYGINDVNVTVDKLHLDEPKNLIDLDITRDSLQTGFANAQKEGWI